MRSEVSTITKYPNYRGVQTWTNTGVDMPYINGCTLDHAFTGYASIPA